MIESLFGALVAGALILLAFLDLVDALKERQKENNRFLYGAYADGNKIMGDQWKP